jgi:putative intracellular protease/amidase
MSKGTILIVPSGADKLKLKSGRVHDTGVYLNELAVPVMAAVAAGYSLVLATPKGNRPVIDQASRRASHFGGSEGDLKYAVEFFETHPALQSPRMLHAVIEDGLERYAGVFVPGGHAPITDLSQDSDFGIILRHFHDRSKPTALLCHGPVALLAAVPEMKVFRVAMEAGTIDAGKAVAKGWPYAGYRMTVFNNAEETIAEEQILHDHLTFYVADALQAAGGLLTSSARPFEPNVTRDRELITGQNPRSDHELGEAFVAALDEQQTDGAA